MEPDSSPTITSVSPQSGVAGSEVTITGTDFSAVASENSVSFNGTAATVSSASETTLLTEVPAGATDGPVAVTVDGKTATGPPFDVVTTGTLAVATATSGTDPDSDGYRVSVDGADEGAIGINDIDGGLYVELEEGDQDVALTDVAPHCSPAGDNPATVDIVPGDTTAAAFDVVCAPLLVNEIVFDSDRDGDKEIFVMNADGSNPRQLTDNDVDDLAPVVSPDGTRIAYASLEPSGLQTVVMDADGGDPQVLTSIGATNAPTGWSPDGSRILFYSNRDGDLEIYSMAADGSDQVRITNDPGTDFSAVWSPDGNTIAFVSDRDGDLDIYVMNPDGTGIARVTDDPGIDRYPAWSPDDSRIALQSDRDGNPDVYVMNADGTGVARITDMYVGTDGPAVWSPDGTQLAFFSLRDGGGEIYKVSADGTGLRTNLTANPAFDANPSWSPLQQAPGS